MTEQREKSAAELPLDRRVGPYRFHILGSGRALCPYCNGAGLKPTAATTYALMCDYCNGAGAVLCRGA